MRAGNQLTDASATPVSQISEGHTGGAVSEEGLIDVTLVGVIVADKPTHAVEAFGFIFAEVKDEGHQFRQDRAEVHLREVFAKTKKDLFDRVQACIVETVPGKEQQATTHSLRKCLIGKKL